MFAAVLAALPIALGTILATAPVLAIPLLLASRPDRGPLYGFLVGWFAGFLGLGALAIAFADITLLPTEPGAFQFEGLRIVLGLALLVFAALKWSKRPLPGEMPETPGWMRRFDTITPRGAALVGAGLAALNPKNAVLAISGALAVAGATPSPPAQALAFLIHSVVASAGLIAPLVAITLLGDRATAPLDRLRDAVARHNATAMAVVLAALGLYVIYAAVTGG